MTHYELGRAQTLAEILWHLIQELEDSNGFETGVHAGSVKQLIKAHEQLNDEIHNVLVIEEPK